MEILEGLNPQQRQAVTAPDGPVLVLAGPGSGKTRVLTYRVAYLVEQGIDPGRILLLTFTNRAAREMLDRAEQLVGEAVGGLWGGTFHHMANRILRRFTIKFDSNRVQQRFIGFGIDFGFELLPGAADDPSDKGMVIPNEAGKQPNEPCP